MLGDNEKRANQKRVFDAEYDYEEEQDKYEQNS